MSDENKISRREFIKDAAVGAAAVAGAGALAGLSSTPAQAQAQCPTPWLPAKWDKETDVIMVGFGGAGGSGAIAAFDAGAKVLILEKMPKGLEGGNTFCSGGGSVYPYDKAKAVDHMYALCMGDYPNPTTPKELIRAFVDTLTEDPVGNTLAEQLGLRVEYRSGNTVDFSRFFLSGPSQGGGTTPGKYTTTTVPPGSYTTTGGPHPSGLAHDEPYYPGRPPGPGQTGKELGKGMALFTAIKEHVEKRGIEVMYGTPATELIQNPLTKEILGVKAASGGKEIYIKARRAVVMTLGGYENSPELQTWFSNPGIRTYPAGTPGNTGDGIFMVQRVGAVLWHMCVIEWSALGVLLPSKFIASPWPAGVDCAIPVNPASAGSFVIVNKYGNRFTNTARTLGHTKRNTMVGFSDYFYLDGEVNDPTSKSEYTNYPFFIVFDESRRKKGPITSSPGCAGQHGLYTWSTDNSTEIANGLITKADTIKELAAKLKIDPVGLEKTISKYNEYCGSGKDPEFGTPKGNLIPIGSPPYYGARLEAVSLNTQGGPKRDGECRILDKYDKPIPRLYAAGEFGSIYGALYHGSGNVPEATVVGRTAGRNAAKEKPWDVAA